MLWDKFLQQDNTTIKKQNDIFCDSNNFSSWKDGIQSFKNSEKIISQNCFNYCISIVSIIIYLIFLRLQRFYFGVDITNQNRFVIWYCKFSIFLLFLFYWLNIKHRKNGKIFKGAFSGLSQFLAIESPLNIIKNTFYFTSKALFVLKIFKFLPWFCGHVVKWLD